MCYAYFYAMKYNKSFMGVQMTYANLETEDIKRFYDIFTREELETWFLLVLKEYDKWARLEAIKRERLLDSIKPLPFPFPYRPGQKKLAASVYRTIEQKKELFIQAPTGIGKTMSALYPAIKAIGEGLADKVFYLTAKTITRTVAEEAFSVLREKGLCMTSVTITAKEKICPMAESVCNPDVCPYALGHYDRINEALYDILTNEVCFDRETILGFAGKHQVCPFEYSLDLTLFSEGIICDYNYVYDPNVYLRRFFGDTAKSGKYIFLVDEAHNLPDRAREMFSARLVKEDVLLAEKLFKEISGNKMGDSPEAVKAAKKVLKELKALNKKLLAYKKDFDQPEETAQVLYDIELLALQTVSLQDAFGVFLEETRVHADDELLNFYFDLRHFNAMYETMDDHYLIYASSEKGRFMITLLCANPANCLHTAGESCKHYLLFCDHASHGLLQGAIDDR